jgi:hypothetical protein
LPAARTPEPTTVDGVLSGQEEVQMDRSVALRAGVLFVIVAALAATTGFASGVAAAEALFMISASLCAVLLFFGFTAPSPEPAPVAVRRRR